MSYCVNINNNKSAKTIFFHSIKKNNFCWGNQGQVGLENPHLVKSQNHIFNRTDDTNMTASFSDRELKYLWTWAWFTPYNASIRKTPPTARVQKV